MRCWWFLLFLCLTVTSDALPTFEGMKADNRFASSTSVPSMGNILQMLVALGVVVCLIGYVLPKLIHRFNGKVQHHSSGNIKVEESINFGQGKLYLVNVEGRKLLLCSTPQNITCLADLTDSKLSIPISHSKEKKPVFSEILSESYQNKGLGLQVREPSNPPKVNISAATVEKGMGTITNRVPDDIAGALERLKRLKC